MQQVKQEQEEKKDQEENLVYVGTPTLDEIKKYFLEQQRFEYFIY